jgi:hypothetical protein
MVKICYYYYTVIFYSSPNIIKMIKSRRMRWAGREACTGRRDMHIVFWGKSQKRLLGRARYRMGG